MKDCIATDYETLKLKMSEIASLRRVAALLSWDTQVMMPPTAISVRGPQSAQMARLMHREFTAGSIGSLLDRLLQCEGKGLTARQWFNVKKLHQGYQHSLALGEELVGRRAELSARGYATWQKGKAENRLDDYLPVLSEWMDLIPRIGQKLYPHLSAYDARLEVYEEGLRLEQVQKIFATLRSGLIPLLKRLKPLGENIPALPGGHYAIEDQMKVGTFLASALGFDLKKGRLDTSAHPFSLAIHPEDVRLTTRFSLDQAFYGLKSLVHECGHGMYEQGVPWQEDANMPSSSTRGMVVHESQSLFWERMVYKSHDFWKWFLPIFKSHFKAVPGDLSAWEYYRSINRVKPGQIRIDADELCYPLHILLRFELETELFSGTLAVKDLQDAWVQKSEDYLGITPESLSLGVLQDVHWADGSFGYFPTYTLGAILANQLYSSLSSEMSEVPTLIASGNFGPILHWLRRSVHSKGALFTMPELVTEICGHGLDADAYLRYLEEKYVAIHEKDSD